MHHAIPEAISDELVEVAGRPFTTTGAITIEAVAVF